MSTYKSPAGATKNRLQELREEEGTSQKALGALVGVDGGTISRWESFKSSIPDGKKEQLAEHLGVSVAFLMCWAHDRDDQP